MTSHFDESQHPRHRDGQFAQKHNSAPTGVLTAGESALADASPSDIDTQLTDIYQRRGSALAQIERSAKNVRQLMADPRDFRRHSGAELTPEEIASAKEAATASKLGTYNLRSHLSYYQDAKATLQMLDEEEAPLATEFTRRPWPRFFLVPGGHIHSSMHCSTCNRNGKPTRFGWLPDLSGQSEADAVAAHGALLCTTCYPTAPVEWTNHYEKEAERKAAEYCPGSGTDDWKDGKVRTGYMSGNGGYCGAWAGTTSRYNTAIRKHKPPKA